MDTSDRSGHEAMAKLMQEHPDLQFEVQGHCDNTGSDAVNDPLHNAIGPVGAYFAFGVFMTLGVAGYLLPLLFLVWGILLFSPRRAATASRVLWSAAILAALAVLFDMNGAFWNRITSSSLALDGSGRASFLSALNLESFAGGLAGHNVARLL